MFTMLILVKLEIHDSPVPTYFAAVCLVLCNLNSDLDLRLFEVK